MTISDLILQRDSRPTGYEVAFIAKALAAPESMPKRGAVPMSDVGAFVLNVARTTSHGTDFVNQVAREVQFESEAFQLDCIGMAHLAANATAQELAEVGSVTHVVEMLASLNGSQPLASSWKRAA